MSKHTVLYLSHGGGPMPLLGDPGHREMVSRLKEIAAEIPRPDAIIMISAHWETDVATVTTGANPELIYDYYGFPAESYTIKYPAPGEPALAEHIKQALQTAGISVKTDAQRGFDHGMFVPLTIMYPEADIPCVQLSMLSSLDPAEHISIGSVLQTLKEKNLLIIGSGYSFHNMRAFFAPETTEIRAQNEAFESWLLQTCGDKQLTEDARTKRLVNWELAPAARFCHPREEHLLPLHVCYGAAQAPCKKSYELQIAGKKASMYLW
ncbi:MAG: class III extradiol ring-cleavage dioxygenase [Thiolinea sp.]